MSPATIQPRTYLVIYIALLVLLGLTIVDAYIPVHVIATVTVFSLATFKAILIVLYFMHVKESSNLVRVFAGAGLLWLGILIGGTLHDYMARGWLTPPGG